MSELPLSPPTGPPSTGRRGTAAGLMLENLRRVVLGDQAPLELCVAAFVSGGHLLLEDVPGVGKTLLARSLAVSIGGSFGRIQGTADLLPSDLTGVSVYDEATRSWAFRPGPLFNNVVLVDELNRATPRTQSALLEAMGEGQVSVDGESHQLPRPFFVVATQNPAGDLGTFPLVAGQRDRFTLSLSMGLPGRAAERDLVAGRGGQRALEPLRPVITVDDWAGVQRSLDDDVFVHASVAEYALDLVDSIRSRVTMGAPLSPRATMAFVRVARAHALVEGRDHVAPDDIQAVAVGCLAHRLLDATEGHLPTARSWVAELVGQVPVPPSGDS